MDAFLGLFPLPARLSARHALSISHVLLGNPAPSTEGLALAMSLLSNSWSRGRMPLANHLKRIQKAVSAGLLGSLTSSAPYLASVHSLEEANRAAEAHQAVGRWTSALLDDDRDLDDIWQAAIHGFAQRLELQPEDPASVKTLQALLQAMSAYTEGRDEPDEEALVPVSSMVPRTLLRDGPVSLGSQGMPALVQAVMANTSPAMRLPLRNRPGAGSQQPSALQPELPEGPRVKLWSSEEAASLLSRTQAGPMDGNAKLSSMLHAMASADGWRSLHQVPVGAQAAVLDELYARFPHFSEVLDFIKRSLALAGCGTDGAPARFAPILLRSEPGIGKTYFAQEVARLLDLAFVERDLSVTTEAFVINGNDSSWKGAKPGVVLDTLLYGQTANPLILLNEVDKANARGTNNSPIAPMYALLEPTSAMRFIDEFAPVPIDASHVNWILTANDGDIPSPVLSRLEVFDIRKPTEQECRQIAQSVWLSLTERALPKGHGFVAELPAQVLDFVGGVSPRVMRKALTYAAGAAVSAGRRHLDVSDLQIAGRRYGEQRRASVGFIQH